MSVMLPSATQAFLARYDALKATLPGEAAVRAAAAGLFRAGGLPGVREESWKYTNLRPLGEAGFESAPGNASLPPLPEGIARLVFVAGRYRADLSTPPAGISVTRFADHPAFGRLARPAEERLVALNTMLAEDGAGIEVPAGQDGGVVLLLSLAAPLAGQRLAFHPRHTVQLGAGARLTLIEVSAGQGEYLQNPVMEITLADGAALSHVRLQDESAAAFHLATLYAEVAAGATYDSFSLNLGSRLARSEIHARLIGDGGTVHLNAAQLLGGAQHGDFTTVVAHDAPACASRQTVRNVLEGHARGVFQGRIEVARAAQKTDGYQKSETLLLSAHAEIDCKPELQIYADDVKCSHGATVGELDAEQIFYLRSRGVPEAQARTMLVRAFLADGLAGVADATARGMLEAALEQRWEQRAA